MAELLFFALRSLFIFCPRCCAGMMNSKLICPEKRNWLQSSSKASKRQIWPSCLGRSKRRVNLEGLSENLTSLGWKMSQWECFKVFFGKLWSHLVPTNILARLQVPCCLTWQQWWVSLENCTFPRIYNELLSHACIKCKGFPHSPALAFQEQRDKEDEERFLALTGNHLCPFTCLLHLISILGLLSAVGWSIC